MIHIMLHNIGKKGDAAVFTFVFGAAVTKMKGQSTLSEPAQVPLGTNVAHSCSVTTVTFTLQAVDS